MIKYLNYLDIFGTTFSFTTLGNSKFHTNIGYFLSFTCYALTGAFISVFGVNLINRANPKIISERVRPIDYKSALYNTTRFTFAWRIEDETGYLWDYTNKLFPEVQYHLYERDPVSNELIIKRKEIYQPERCTNENVLDPIFIAGRNITQYFCVDFQKYNLTMGGFWDGNFVASVQIVLYHCKNNNRKGTCSSLSDLKRYLISENKLYLSVYYPDFFFEPNNLNSPLRY